MFENLGAGEYNLNVTDARSCMTLVSITIVEPEEIFVGEISGITDVNEFQTYNYSVPESENFLFNWSVEGGSIVSGQGTNTVNIQWTSNTEGLVKTIAESESGCLSDTASLVVSIQITTGAEDRSTVRVSVYPNPAGDKLYVSSDNEVFVSIYDITGQLQISTINKLIDLSQLNKGSYFVSIRSQNLLHTVRILKL